MLICEGACGSRNRCKTHRWKDNPWETNGSTG